jgi:hypothetical protein
MAIERMYRIETGRYVRMMSRLMTAHKDLVGRVKAHDNAHGHHHFQVAVLVPGIAAADFGKEVGAAPAEQRDQREPKPHITFFS